MLSKVEMPQLPWHMVQEWKKRQESGHAGIGVWSQKTHQKIMFNRKAQKTYHSLRPSEIWWGARASPRSSLLPGLSVETVTELGLINNYGNDIPLPPSKRDQMVALSHQKPGGYNYDKDNNIWQEWQPRGPHPQRIVEMDIELGISRGKVNIYNQKKAKMEKQEPEYGSPALHQKSLSLVQCLELSHSSDLKPIDLRGGRSCSTAASIHVMIPQSFPKETCGHLLWWLYTLGKRNNQKIYSESELTSVPWDPKHCRGPY